mgnify:CR=1 FL=1
MQIKGGGRGKSCREIGRGSECKKNRGGNGLCDSGSAEFIALMRKINGEPDQRKIECAAAGCSLMGLVKKARDAASMPKKCNRSDVNENTRQLVLTGIWLSLLRRGVPVSWPRSEEDEWGDFARRDAEAQRDSLRVSFSLRLRVSAGASPSHCPLPTDH